MSLMSAELREQMKKYNEALLERVRVVGCERCGARGGEPCTGASRRRIKACHWVRHNEAKRQGLLKGRWFDTEKHGVTP